MSEVTTIVCPNCGANATNRLNCEYCGSLLVRFTDHQKTIDYDKYGKDAKTIPGLEEELEKNLSLQYTCGETSIIVTDIIHQDEYDENDNGQIFQIVQSSILKPVGAELITSPEGKPGIALIAPFQTRSMDASLAEVEKQRANYFRALDCFFLFESRKTIDGVQYYIDFGEDYITAARIISQIYQNGLQSNLLFSTHTYNKDKVEVDEGTGFIESFDVKQVDKKKRNTIIAIIPLIILLIVKLLIDIL